MLKVTITVLSALAAALIFYASASAQDIKDVPEDLQAFITKLRDLSVVKDMNGLEMCVLPYLGMYAYGDTFTRSDFKDAMTEDYVREFRHESEGMTDMESMRLTEFLFGEYSCFGMLTRSPMDKGIFITEAQRWDHDVQVAWEDTKRNYLAYVTEEYVNGDVVYCIEFSTDISQRMIIGKIGNNMYVLGFEPWE